MNKILWHRAWVRVWLRSLGFYQTTGLLKTGTDLWLTGCCTSPPPSLCTLNAMEWNALLIHLSPAECLNFYLQKTLPDAHMPLLQPKAQGCHCLIFAWPHSLLQGQSRGMALLHGHWPWARHTASVQVRQTGQVFLRATPPHSPGCSKSTIEGQATLALEGILPAEPASQDQAKPDPHLGEDPIPSGLIPFRKLRNPKGEPKGHQGLSVWRGCPKVTLGTPGPC